VSLAWGAVGWTGTVLKSAAVAIAVMLLWITIVQVQVDYYATMMPKLRVPSTTCCPAPPSTSPRCCSAGQLRGSLGAAGVVASRLAFAILAAYTLACFALPVIVTRWRDILCCPAPGPHWAVRRDGKPGRPGSASSDVPADHVIAAPDGTIRSDPRA
jgi:hypothetical protein